MTVNVFKKSVEICSWTETAMTCLQVVPFRKRELYSGHVKMHTISVKKIKTCIANDKSREESKLLRVITETFVACFDKWRCMQVSFVRMFECFPSWDTEVY